MALFRAKRPRVGSAPPSRLAARALADARALAEGGADRFIAGTFLKRGGRTGDPVDPGRVRALARVVHEK